MKIRSNLRVPIQSVLIFPHIHSPEKKQHDSVIYSQTQRLIEEFPMMGFFGFFLILKSFLCWIRSRKSRTFLSQYYVSLFDSPLSINNTKRKPSWFIVLNRSPIWKNTHHVIFKSRTRILYGSYFFLGQNTHHSDIHKICLYIQWLFSFMKIIKTLYLWSFSSTR